MFETTETSFDPGDKGRGYTTNGKLHQYVRNSIEDYY